MDLGAYRTWAEIDLSAAKENIKTVKGVLSPDTKLLAIVKADAYGHGAAELAKVFLENGAFYLGVATADEGIALRKSGIKAPILLLSGGFGDLAPALVEYDITSAVFDLDFARALADAAVRRGKRAKIHIKINTGMSRLGFPYDDGAALDTIIRVCSLPGIEAEGIFTHFSKADEIDDSFARLQFLRFMSVIDALRSRGLEFQLRHCCNSAATMRFPEMHLDMVRPGIILYGCMPSCDMHFDGFRPVMSLKARVTALRTLKKGEAVSYGGAFVAPRDMTLGVATIGYADGYSRALSGKISLLADGKKVPVTGKICMDLCMFDATDVQNISVGDSVVLFGRSGENFLPVEELADISGTISYEVLCRVGNRVVRVYIP